MHELGPFQDPPGLPGGFATWRFSRSGLWWVKTSHYLEFEMFDHPAEAVTSTPMLHQMPELPSQWEVLQSRYVTLYLK